MSTAKFSQQTVGTCSEICIHCNKDSQDFHQYVANPLQRSLPKNRLILVALAQFLSDMISHYVT